MHIYTTIVACVAEQCGILRKSCSVSCANDVQQFCPWPAVQSMLSSPSLSIVSIPFLWSSILCDVSFGSPRPLVPTALRHQLFLALHGLSHPGACASQWLLSSRFVWHGLTKHVSLWKRSCLRCQQSKIQSHVKSPIPRIPVPGRRFSHVHLDQVKPLPSCQSSATS